MTTAQIETLMIETGDLVYRFEGTLGDLYPVGLFPEASASTISSRAKSSPAPSRARASSASTSSCCGPTASA